MAAGVRAAWGWAEKRRAVADCRLSWFMAIWALWLILASVGVVGWRCGWCGGGGVGIEGGVVECFYVSLAEQKASVGDSVAE